jgi:hypothetical protein
MNKFKFANHIGYTDVNPFEVIRYVSDKCIVIREMDAELDPSFKPNITPGGFFGHCTNNSESEQKWIITPSEIHSTVRIRLHKGGQWKDKSGRRFQLGDAPRKFYDYNF